nr:twin-arginine translocation pathway signal [Mycobacterium sp. URHB0044]
MTTAMEQDSTDVDAEAVEAVAPPAGRWRRVLLRWRLIAVVLLLLSSAGVAGRVYVTGYRPAQQTNDTAATAAITAASQGAVALLTYAPDSFARDLAAAKSHLTGDFLTYYAKFADEIVGPAATQKSVKTQATVVRAAISELHPESAKVLIFLNQTTSSKDSAEPVQAASSVVVSLVKSDEAWLISAFDPV